MYIIFVYVCGYINRVPVDSRCQKIDQVPFTHKQTPTQTHTCNVFVFVFVVRAHSTCPVTFSSTTFWLSFWLILFCLLLPAALARLFIYFACFVSFRKCRKANIAHTPRVRPSAKSISDCCPTNTYTCVCVCPVCSSVVELDKQEVAQYFGAYFEELKPRKKSTNPTMILFIYPSCCSGTEINTFFISCKFDSTFEFRRYSRNLSPGSSTYTFHKDHSKKEPVIKSIASPHQTEQIFQKIIEM